MKDEPNEVRYVDYEKLLVNRDEQATLKIPQQIEFSYFTNQTFRSGYANQRSMVIFLAKTDISKRKEPMLEVFNEETIPEMTDFLNLDLPIRQIVKIDRGFNAKETAATHKSKGGYNQAGTYDQFEIDTLPKAEIIMGASNIDTQIKALRAKKVSEEAEDADDAGYVFEVDLTQSKRVGRVMNELLVKHIQKLKDKKKSGAKAAKSDDEAKPTTLDDTFELKEPAAGE